MKHINFSSIHRRREYSIMEKKITIQTKAHQIDELYAISSIQL